jgi:hypothetical protein
VRICGTVETTIAPTFPYGSIFSVGESLLFASWDEVTTLRDGSFEPLGRRILGRISVETLERSRRAPTAPKVLDVLVKNEGAGALPLWGFRAGDVPEEP